MKFDYLKEVEATPYPFENVVREKKVKSRFKKITVTPFGLVTTQLIVCLAASVAYLTYLLIANAENFGLTQIFAAFVQNKAI